MNKNKFLICIEIVIYLYHNVFISYSEAIKTNCLMKGAQLWLDIVEEVIVEEEVLIQVHREVLIVQGQVDSGIHAPAAMCHPQEHINIPGKV